MNNSLVNESPDLSDLPPPSAARRFSHSLEGALGAVDLGGLLADYGKYNELFWRDAMVPAELVASCTREAEALRPRVVRKRVPGYKKSGSVNYFDIVDAAPNIVALYNDPALIALLSAVSGARLLPCPDDDPHAAALYYYSEAGDGIGFHYDSSHYAGDRYTVLLGLVNRTTHAELVCHPYRKINGPEVELRIATHPGTFVFFNGGNIYHSVSPIVEDEERIVLTLEYVTDQYMNPARRFISNLKDAMTYFGFKGILGRAKKKAPEST
jgi:hypothetical protein